MIEVTERLIKITMTNILHYINSGIIVILLLISVAFVTVAERKTMAYMQRRLGPNIVGVFGLLQAFADALKLLLKEYVAPKESNIFLFFLGPIITLIFALLGAAVVVYGPGLMILDYHLGLLYAFAMSSLSTYGVLLAGWAANSKYAFLGAIRSTAQLISYELILTSALLIVIYLTNTLSPITTIELQRAIWNIAPLFPIFIVFGISCLAETNRAPFDLAEAESELVSGFNTEHAAVIFVFFFLAEYTSMVLISMINSNLFLGGYLYFIPLYYTLYISNYILFGITTGIKLSMFIFLFIWIRASLPRIRFDQLMTYCWTILLPIVVGFIIAIPFFINYFLADNSVEMQNIISGTEDLTWVSNNLNSDIKKNK